MIDISEFIEAVKVDFENKDNFEVIPENSLPLFGEIYLALSPELKQKLCKVYQFDDKDHILKS